ncbi:DUF2690 domain-containing protein [Streptomyces sp. NPDC046805]|uniref:helix-turn-helix domain-containing protein n=1 Tax=Streptomyces sp. NPDC046805 TaxID=3155134 RepID=UPI0033E04114
MTSADRPVECHRLATALRELRARTGLSLAALSAKTPYSKSSWERYLNGRTLPPRQAVVKLCELAGAEPGRPLALWELADAAWSGRAAGAAPPPAVSPPPPDDGGAGRSLRHRRVALLAGALVGAAVAVTAVLLATTGALETAGTRAQAPTATPAPQANGCHGGGCTGKDPEMYRCGVDPLPTTLRRRTFSGGTAIKIRYGADCGTVWARIDLGNIGDRVEIVAPRHAPLRSEVKDKEDASGSLSSPMVAVGRHDLDRVRACLVRDGRRDCFGTRPSTGSHPPSPGGR